MNYKISTYLLAAILAVIIIYACGPASQSDENHEKAIVQTESEFSDEFLKSLCAMAESMDTTTGDFITPEEAFGKLELYKRERRQIASPQQPYDPKKDIYGFVFGLAKVRELITRIDKINSQSPDSVVGIRVYMARRIGTGSKPVPDVFMLPVGKKGKNIYKVDTDFDSTKQYIAGDYLILNRSSPCPNQCQE